LSITGLDSPPSVADITEDEEIYILQEITVSGKVMYVLVTEYRVKVLS
jgi:hypothetical protein